MRARAVQIILKRCLGHKDGERVLVVTDPPMEAFARAFQRHALALGVETDLLTTSVRRAHGEEPSAAVAEALRHAPISVLLTSKSLTHTRARRDACEKHGARVASMPGVDVTRVEGLLELDYDELRARSEELAKILEGGGKVRLTTPAGTDLRFD